MCSFQDKLGKDVGQGQRWCTGIVRRISDEENPWIKAGATRACYKAGESAEVNWDAIPDADMVVACVGIIALNPRKWNKDTQKRHGERTWVTMTMVYKL